MFANDVNFSCQGNSPADIERKLNINFDNVHKWLIANKLTLNKEETEYMIVGFRQKLNLMSSYLQMVIGDQTIKQVPVKESLGDHY